MSYEKVLQAGKLSIGTKQTMRAVELGKALEVYIANDADPRVTSRIAHMCKKLGVQVTNVESMKQLGKACGIEVGAATAAIVNDR